MFYYSNCRYLYIACEKRACVVFTKKNLLAIINIKQFFVCKANLVKIYQRCLKYTNPKYQKVCAFYMDSNILKIGIPSTSV